MAEVLLFHHAQGLTPGVLGLAQELRDAGHVVHTPDLYEGHVFDTLDEGMGYARKAGFDVIAARGEAAASDLPAELVYVGLSLGAVPAQKLAQTRAGARGVVLLHACLPAAEFGAWPDGLPAQIHGMDADPFFAEEGGDLDAARELVAVVPTAELFLYEGDRHLFTDSGLPEYDEAAAGVVRERVRRFLEAAA
ncbi:dienelactone hydrolase family protein [Streptomyces sp. NPDC060194]|uniref:dienelactone hydrolase family protein n=1 Tax=Streptomyces sp. NPDC060194 TaxID=3347069 RepID=UPI003661094C